MTLSCSGRLHPISILLSFHKTYVPRKLPAKKAFCVWQCTMWAAWLLLISLAPRPPLTCRKKMFLFCLQFFSSVHLQWFIVSSEGSCYLIAYKTQFRSINHVTVLLSPDSNSSSILFLFPSFLVILEFLPSIAYTFLRGDLQKPKPI